MSRRGYRRKPSAAETLVKGIGALFILIALAIGGLANFIPVLIQLVLSVGFLALIGWIGYRFFKHWQNQKANRPNMFGGTARPRATNLNWPPVASVPTPIKTVFATPTPKWSIADIQTALGEIDWYQFEKFCAALLRSEGYAVERKGGAQPDGGVDLVATKDGEALLVQCKHWRTWTVQEKVIRELLGSMTHYQAKRGALYVLKDATRPAEAFAQQHGITIRDGRDLAGRAKAQLTDVKLNELLNSRDHHCPKCESRMVWRTGDFTPFWGCSTYPRCRGVLKHSGAR
jgi:Holliday junction resolvase